MSYSYHNRQYERRSEPQHGQSSHTRWSDNGDYSRGGPSSSRYGNQNYRRDYNDNRRVDDRRAYEDIRYSDNDRNDGYNGNYGYGSNGGGYEQYQGRSNHMVGQDQWADHSGTYQDRYSNQDYQNDYTSNQGRGAYIPPHQRNPLPPRPPSLPPFPPTIPGGIPQRKSSPQSWSNPTSQTRQYNTRSSKSPYSRDKTVTPPPVTLPSSEYLKLSRPQSIETLKSNKVIPKLLILDLNGALVYRNRSSDLRKSFPRPYLNCFLDYLFLPMPDGENEKRGCEVFVWSSAQPHNVRGMVENTFGSRFIEGIWEEETSKGKLARDEGESRLLGVWARDKMGLTSYDYSKKVQTTKDLRKIIEHFRYPDYSINNHSSMNEYDESNIVLLDDSPLKGIYQPFNQIIIPEFGKEEYQNSKFVANLLESQGDENENENKHENQIDQTLLAIIGILEELKFINNVPSWIRSGGLSNPNSISNESDEIQIYDEIELQLEDLPSHDNFQHWFKDENIHKIWIEKGKIALNKRGIEIKHGIIPDINQNQNSKPSSPSSRNRRNHSPVKLYNKRGYHTNNSIDEDEISIPEISIENHSSSSIELTPNDVASYIENLISGTSSLKLSLEQKDSLQVAQNILSDLQNNEEDFPSISIRRQNNQNGLENHRQPDQSKVPEKGCKSHIRERGKKKKLEFQKAFSAAKSLDPILSRKKYIAQIRSERDNPSTSSFNSKSNTKDIVGDQSIEKVLEDQDDIVEIIESDEGSEGDIEEISKDDYNNNNSRSLSVEGNSSSNSNSRSRSDRENRRSIGQQSDLSIESVEKERDEGSKKSRSDCWSGLDQVMV